jgi:hypothetical protein
VDGRRNQPISFTTLIEFWNVFELDGVALHWAERAALIETMGFGPGVASEWRSEFAMKASTSS